MLHTLPASKGKARASVQDAVAEEKSSKGLHPSMATIPRLVSVVEIIKREYLKTMDPALAEAGSLSGLHQYNEVGDLADAGAENAEEDRLESLARALQGRHQCVPESVPWVSD